jgi:hypothetical protein
VKVAVKDYPPSPCATSPSDIDPVGQFAGHLEKGGVSDMEATADKGVLVYAADKKAAPPRGSPPRYARSGRSWRHAYARPDAAAILAGHRRPGAQADRYRREVAPPGPPLNRGFRPSRRFGAPHVEKE